MNATEQEIERINHFARMIRESIFYGHGPVATVDSLVVSYPNEEARIIQAAIELSPEYPSLYAWLNEPG